MSFKRTAPLKLLPGAALLIAALVLTGCSKPSTRQNGRWVVVPAAAALTGGEAGAFSAWRLDTRTGDLELCQYASRLINGTLAESLKCSEPAKGPSRSVNIDIPDNAPP